jgi:hypothetical protein
VHYTHTQRTTTTTTTTTIIIMSAPPGGPSQSHVSSSSSSSSSRGSAVAINEHGELGLSPALREAHDRRLAIAAGQTHEALQICLQYSMGMLPADVCAGVMSSIEAVQAVEAAVFAPANGQTPQFTTAQALAIAEKFSLHPDSVRMIALTMFKRWSERKTFTLFRSYYVKDLSKPLDARENSSTLYAVLLRYACPANALPRQLLADQESVASDSNVYMWSTSDTDIHIYSVTGKLSDTQEKRLRAVFSDTVVLDKTWAEAFVASIYPKWSNKIIGHILLSIAYFFITNEKKNSIFQDNEEFKMPRLHLYKEKKIIPLLFRQQAHNSKAKMLVANIQQLSKLSETLRENSKQQALDTRVDCACCRIGMAIVRCMLCTELLYCSTRCKDFHLPLHVSRDCRSAQKQKKGVALPPGGVQVPKDDAFVERVAKQMMDK